MSANGNTDVTRELDMKHEKLEELRQLVQSDKHLDSRTDDVFLQSFLWARKYDTQRAFHLIKNYYATRKKYPEVFKNLRPSSVQKCMEDKIGGIIVMKDFLLGIGRTDRWDPDNVDLKDILRNITLQLDYQLKEGTLRDTKIVVIFDAAGLSWKHLLQINPRLIYIFISSLYACYPIRYSQFHVVNENRIFRAVLLMCLPFLSKKFKSRIHVHGSSLETLHKLIEPRNLPVDFGGDLPPFDPSESNNFLRENEQFFIDNEKFWTLEKTK